MFDYKLYGYWRSSCSWRVRWGLLIKGLAFEQTPINLKTGEHLGEDFLKIAPGGRLPVLVTPDGQRLSESLAILELLEEIHPENSLLPEDHHHRAAVREICQIIASGIQPLQNLHLIKAISHDRQGQVAFAAPYIDSGLKRLERLVNQTSRHCSGDQITMADLCLIPQLYNARRFEIDTTNYPRLHDLEMAAMETEPARLAHPDQQPDADN